MNFASAEKSPLRDKKLNAKRAGAASPCRLLADSGSRMVMTMRNIIVSVLLMMMALIVMMRVVFAVVMMTTVAQKGQVCLMGGMAQVGQKRQKGVVRMPVHRAPPSRETGNAPGGLPLRSPRAE